MPVGGRGLKQRLAEESGHAGQRGEHQPANSEQGTGEAKVASLPVQFELVHGAASVQKHAGEHEQGGLGEAMADDIDRRSRQAAGASTNRVRFAAISASRPKSTGNVTPANDSSDERAGYAVPVLAGSAAYATTELVGLAGRLDAKPFQARFFYSVILLTTLLGASFQRLGINPIQALYWSAVVNGILAVPLMVLMMLIVRNPRAMGRLTLGPRLSTIGWTATGVMAVATILFFASLF